MWYLFWIIPTSIIRADVDAWYSIPYYGVFWFIFGLLPIIFGIRGIKQHKKRDRDKE